MTIKTIRKKRPLPAKELAEAYDVSVRTIYRWNSQTREEWIDEQATLRESIRAYHDDDGHSWAATAEHFNMTQGAVRARAYRARKEREAEAAEKSKQALREATVEIRHADLQIEVEDAEDGGVLLTIIDSARLSLSLPRRTARELLDAIDACMKTGERQTTDSVDVWRTADDLPLFGMHVEVDGTSWTCGAVRSWDVDGLADELEALLE